MIAEDRAIRRDRMRFIKNSLSANLAMLGILFNVFYFISICRSDVGTWYYTILIGASIVYNLIFMLAVFLSSEGVKSYKRGYSFLLIALGVAQAARILIIPARAHAAEAVVNGAAVQVMGDGQFLWVTICLAVSAACLIAAAAVNLVRCRELAEHLKTLDGQGA